MTREPDLFSGWRYRAVVGSVLLASAGYLLFALWSGWRDVVLAVAQVGYLGVVAALLLSLLNYGLRFIRWQAYLRAMAQPMPLWPSFRIYLAGFALTTTPGKAGEALRGVLLKRWGVPYPTSFAAFLSERLSDLLAIVLLTLIGLTFYPAARPLVAIGISAVCAAFVVLSSERLVMRARCALTGTSRSVGFVRHLLDILLHARRCHAPFLLLGATILSLAAWAAEAWAFHLILSWMGLDVPIAFAVFVYALSMLAGALSFMPGGLGGAEAVMVGLLIGIGVNSGEAVAATIVIRLATLWFAVAIGIVAVFRSKRT